MEWKTVLNTLDVCRLVQFEMDCHIPRDRLTVDDYVDWLHVGLVVNYLVDENGKWVASYQLLEDEDENIHFVGVGVHPTYQGKGLGNMITQHMLTKAGHRILLSKTRQDNIPMQKCLQRAGFRRLPDEIEVDDDEDGVVVDTWTMWQRDPEGTMK